MNSREPSSEFIIGGASAVVATVLTFYVPIGDLGIIKALIFQGIVAAIAGFIGVHFFRFLKDTVPERTMVIIVRSIIILATLLTLYATVYGRFSFGEPYLIREVNVHKYPNLSSRTVFRTSGSVEIIEKSWRRYRVSVEGDTKFDYWVKIKTNNSNTGWVYGSLIEEW